MSDKDLGDALLRMENAGLSGTVDAHDQVRRVLERDRKHVKWWTVLTAAIWLLAVLLGLGVVILFGFVFPLQAKLNDPAPDPRMTVEQRREFQEQATAAFMMGTLLIAVSVIVLSGAALSTVFLLFASRRATLRQVNASLIEVSKQLKELKQALAARPPTT